jgi:excisionase family DNA binding protein
MTAVPSALRRAEPTPLSEKLVWSLADTSNAVGVSVRTVQTAISSGQLVPIRVGRRVLLSPDAVRAWLASLQSPVAVAE